MSKVKRAGEVAQAKDSGFSHQYWEEKNLQLLTIEKLVLDEMMGKRNVVHQNQE